MLNARAYQRTQTMQDYKFISRLFCWHAATVAAIAIEPTSDAYTVRRETRNWKKKTAEKKRAREGGTENVDEKTNAKLCAWRMNCELYSQLLVCQSVDTWARWEKLMFIPALTNAITPICWFDLWFACILIGTSHWLWIASILYCCYCIYVYRSHHSPGVSVWFATFSLRRHKNAYTSIFPRSAFAFTFRSDAVADIATRMNDLLFMHFFFCTFSTYRNEMMTTIM